MECRRKARPAEEEEEEGEEEEREAANNRLPPIDPNEAVTAFVNSDFGRHLMATYSPVRNAAAFVTQMLGPSASTTTTTTTTAAAATTTTTTTSSSFGKYHKHMTSKV